MSALHDHPPSRPAADPWVKLPRSLAFGLPPHLLAVWSRVRSYDWGRGCHASLATLAAGTMSERQLRRSLAQLEARGLLRAEHRPGGTTLWTCLEPADPGHACPPPPDMHVPPTPDMGVRLNKIKIQTNKVKQQHGTLAPFHRSPTEPPQAGPVVVVVEGVTTPGETPVATGDVNGTPAPAAGNPGEVIAIALPADLAVSVGKKGLSLATARRLLGQHGEQAMRDAMATLEADYAGKTVKNWGGLLTAAMREGWGRQRAEEKADKAASDAAIEAAAPPAGTRWARGPAGQVVEVTAIHANAVATPIGVVMRDDWPRWEWLTSTDDVPSPAPIAGEVVDAGATGNTDLHLVRAWSAIAKRSEGQIREKLAQRGIGWERWAAFVAQVGQP